MTGCDRRLLGSLGIHDGSLAAWVKEHQRSNAPDAISDDELQRLRKDNAELKQDCEILKRAGRTFCERDNQVSRCWFIDDNHHLFEVKRLCELVGVSSGPLLSLETATNLRARAC